MAGSQFRPELMEWFAEMHNVEVNRSRVVGSTAVTRTGKLLAPTRMLPTVTAWA